MFSYTTFVNIDMAGRQVAVGKNGTLAAGNGLVLEVDDPADKQVNSSPFSEYEIANDENKLAPTPSRYRFLPWRRKSGEQSQKRASGFIKKSIHNSRLKTILSGPDVEKIRHAYSVSRSASLELTSGEDSDKPDSVLDVERTVLFDDGSS